MKANYLIWVSFVQILHSKLLSNFIYYYVLLCLYGYQILTKGKHYLNIQQLYDQIK